MAGRAPDVEHFAWNARCGAHVLPLRRRGASVATLAHLWQAFIAVAGGKGGRLDYAGFVSLLVTISTVVSQPSEAAPSPGVVDGLNSLLESHLLPYAKRDTAASTRSSLVADSAAAAAIEKDEAALTVLFKSLSQNAGGVSLAALMHELEMTGLLKRVTLTDGTSGELEATEARHAFLDSLEAKPTAPWARETVLSQAAFHEALLRLANARYAPLTHTSLADRAAALISVLTRQTTFEASFAALGPPPTEEDGAYAYPTGTAGSTSIAPSARDAGRPSSLASKGPASSVRTKTAEAKAMEEANSSAAYDEEVGRVSELQTKLASDPATKRVVTSYTRLLKQAFSAVVSEAKPSPAVAASQRKVVKLKNELSSDAAISPSALLGLLSKAGLIGGTSVRRSSAITRDPTGDEDVTLSLSEAEAERLIGAIVGVKLTSKSSTALSVGFTSYVQAVSCVGVRLYEPVVKGNLSVAVEAAFKNLLGQQDVSSTVSSLSHIVAPSRFNAWRDSSPLPGETAAAHSAFLLAWQQLDLSPISGFPLWEKEVHDALHEHYSELMCIFGHYCKSSSRGSIAAGTSMDLDEWGAFCRDAKLYAKGFDAKHCDAIFHDNAAVGAADETPKAAKEESRSGKPGLMSHSFLAAVVSLALKREEAISVAPPSPSSASFLSSVTSMFGKASQPREPQGLPGALTSLLAGYLLPNSHRDGAAAFRRLFNEDAAAQEAVRLSCPPAFARIHTHTHTDLPTR